jgi:hypothetical protein
MNPTSSTTFVLATLYAFRRTHSRAELPALARRADSPRSVSTATGRRALPYSATLLPSLMSSTASTEPLTTFRRSPRDVSRNALAAARYDLTAPLSIS